MIYSRFPRDFSHPESQETIRIPVIIVRLKPKDQWLKDVEFSVMPLDGVKSGRKYAIVLMNPPVGGVRSRIETKSELDLTASTAFCTTVEKPGVNYSYPEGIQPIEISSEDFGQNGDQIAVKFIDEGVGESQSYNSSQHLLIGSSPYQ